MSIELLMQHLQADLRVCLEDPSAEAFGSLVNVLAEVPKTRHQSEDDSSRWWMSHLSTSVGLFSQCPTKAGYLSLVRMSNHYLQLTAEGIIKPIRLGKSYGFEPKVDYWSRVLSDRMSMVIDRPTELNVKGLTEQLEEYCKLKGVEL